MAVICRQQHIQRAAFKGRGDVRRGLDRQFKLQPGVAARHLFDQVTKPSMNDRRHQPQTHPPRGGGGIGERVAQIALCREHLLRLIEDHRPGHRDPGGVEFTVKQVHLKVRLK